MNIPTALIPLAAAVLDTVVHDVGDAVHDAVAFARMLHAQAGDQEAGGAESTTVTTVLAPDHSALAQQVQRDVLRQRFETLRSSVHQQLVQRCAQRGIDLSEPLVIAAHASGQFVESGQHWDRAQVEELLASDSALRNQIGQLLQLGSQLRSGAPTGAESGTSGTPRLVVTEKEAFFQVQY